MTTTTETTPVSAEQAKSLLRMTANNNSTHLIGSPDTVVGRTLSGSLTLADRLKNFRLTSRNGFEMLTGTLPCHGDHSWYLNRESAAEDPWS
jgi:hypothetical protein